MMLKALGYSYDEISERTGFSWTKVNRSLTEGRRRFFECFGEISTGGRCERFRPMLSAVCDGHAAEEDERTLRAHLSSCQPCRAALRAYRSGPARLAELVPPSVVLPLLERASMWSRFTDWVSGGGGERAGALGAKLQQGAEMVTAQKAAAVVASTAALAGGGAAVHEQVRAFPEREQPARAERQVEPVDAPRAPVEVPASEPASTRSEPQISAPQQDATQAAATTAAAEFGPERSSADAVTEASAASSPSSAPAETESFAAAGAGSPAPPPSAGGREFGP